MNEVLYMTQAECDRKHKITNWMMGTMIGFLALILVVNGWSLYASQNASTQSAIQERDIIHLSSSITELRGEIRSLRTTLERMGSRAGALD